MAFYNFSDKFTRLSGLTCDTQTIFVSHYVSILVNFYQTHWVNEGEKDRRKSHSTLFSIDIHWKENIVYCFQRKKLYQMQKFFYVNNIPTLELPSVAP